MNSEHILTERPSSFFQNYYIRLIAFFGVYVVFARLGLFMASINEIASPVWPATGIAIAILFLNGLHFWPAIFFGSFFITSLSSISPVAMFTISVGNTLEALIGSIVLYFFSQKKIPT